MDSNIWVGIEITRDMRLGGGALSAGGVNLFEHQVGVARQLVPADRILVLTPQSDETLLELIGKHELREIPPFEFIMLMRERVSAGEEGAVVLLRQIAPVRDSTDIRRAIEMLPTCEAVVSASKPPAGHARHQPIPGENTPDYRCLAFEVRRLSQFSGLGVDEDLLFIDWDSFAELIRPDDKPAVGDRIKAWRTSPAPDR